MTYSKLSDLIEGLKRGTGLQIGVVFFGYPRNEYLMLPNNLTIHTSPICWRFKSTSEMTQRCVDCRTKAIRRAVRTGEPFSGYCINGLKEYTHPIAVDGEVIGIIFIGNILVSGEGEERILRRLEERGFSEEGASLLQTMERDMSDEECGGYARLIESYIRLLMKEKSDRDTDDSKKLLWKDIVAFADDNDTGGLTMKELAEIFHYNEKYLGREFKKATGMSMKLYICRRRVERAMELLRETDLCVTEIASKCGFENISYFNRRFRQFAGASPRAYRDSVRKMQEKKPPLD